MYKNEKREWWGYVQLMLTCNKPLDFSHNYTVWSICCCRYLKPMDFDVLLLYNASLLRQAKERKFREIVKRDDVNCKQLIAKKYLNKEGWDILPLITLKLYNLSLVHNEKFQDVPHIKKLTAQNRLCSVKYLPCLVRDAGQQCHCSKIPS